MNGASTLYSLPTCKCDRSGGYAVVIDPTTEGLPANTPVLLTFAGNILPPFFCDIDLQSACRDRSHHAALFGTRQFAVQRAIRTGILRRAGKIP